MSWITHYTSILIQDGNSFVETYYDKESEKWAYAISITKRDGSKERVLHPKPAFYSEEDAKECGNHDLGEIMKVDASKTRRRLENLFGTRRLV